MGLLDDIKAVFTGAAKSQTDQTQTQPDQTQPVTGTSTEAIQSAIEDESINTVLGNLAQATGCTNWQTSIVDLLRMFGVDSSLSARQNLAKELGYTGDLSDTAAMNEWLHAKVMENIKEHHGKLKDLT